MKEWKEQKWVQVIPYLRGETIVCGKKSDMKGSNYCRPTKKVGDTPTLLQDLIKKHGKKKMLEFLLNRTKKGNVKWDTLE